MAGKCSMDDITSAQTILDAIWPHDDIETLSDHLSLERMKANLVEGPLFETPLHWACRNGCAAAASVLIASGANLSTPNLLGQTPLHLACAANHYNAAKVILDAHEKEGTSIKFSNYQDTHIPDQCSILGHHSASPRPQLVASDTKTSLLGSIKNDSVPKLIFNGKSKDVLVVTLGESPFHYACRAGATECIELLLSHGADVNKVGCNGEPPLIMAASTGIDSAVECILAAGVSAVITNGGGETALHAAAGSGHPDAASCLKLILSYNADPAARDNNGETAAHHAASVGAVGALRLLMDYGTPLTLQSTLFNEDSTAETTRWSATAVSKTACNILVYAARNRSSDCLSLLFTRMLETRQRCLIPKADPLPYMPTLMDKELLALFPTLLDKTPEGGTTLQLALSRAPHLAETLLDSCVYMTEKSIGQEANIWNPPKVLLDLILFNSPPRTTECAILLGLSHRARQKVLSHPLTQIVLAVKWKRVRYLFWLLVVIQFIFLVVVMARVILTHGKLLGAITDHSTHAETWLPIQTTSATVSRWTLLSFCVIMSSLELLKIFSAGTKRYFRWDDNGREHILNWYVIVLSIIDVIEILPGSWARVEDAALALSVCFQMLGVVSRFPVIGVYAVMIGRVIQSITTFLFAYIWLYLGFGIAFHILLHENPEEDNADPAIALLKVVIMFVGEYGFPQAFTSNDPVLNWSAHILLAMFVPIMNLLLLNLIIGLTVTDMRRLFQQANYHRQVLLAQLVLYLSALLPNDSSRVVTDDILNLRKILTVELHVDGDEAEACLRLETAESIVNPLKNPDQQLQVVHNVELSEYTLEKLRRILERRWGYSGAFYAPVSPSSVFPSRSPTPTSTTTSASEMDDTIENLHIRQQEYQAHTEQLSQLTLHVLHELKSLRAEIQGKVPNEATNSTLADELPTFVTLPISSQSIYRPIAGRRRRLTSTSSSGVVIS